MPLSILNIRVSLKSDIRPPMFTLSVGFDVFE